MRKIDPSLDLGLHELAKPGEGRGSFRFQLTYAKEQTKDILKNLDNLVKNTIVTAPMRGGNFCLDRVTDPELTHEEDKWERAIYKKWGPQGSGEFISICKRIQAYQYPLKEHGKENRCWGEIDLLGIGTDFLPVPIELKKSKADESPLRMLVEVAAYGFAIRKVWPNVKDHWTEAVRWFRTGFPEPRSCLSSFLIRRFLPHGSPADRSSSQFPETLDKVTLVGVAPAEYWCRCLGLLPETKEGKFPLEAWPPFWELVDDLGEWFGIHFVAVEGGWDNEDTGGAPTIIGARELDLRSLTSDSTADTFDRELAWASRDALLEAHQRTAHHSPSFRR